MMKLNRINNVSLPAILTVVLAVVVGCGESSSSTPQTPETGTSDATGSAGLPGGFLLASAPEGAQTIKMLKASAVQGDEVVVRVVVGGRVKPIVDGRASTVVVDAGLDNPCIAEDDHCKTPWDYCCTPPEDLVANGATLQVVDTDGRVIAADLSEHLTPGATVRVSGIVGPRPDPQVLVINATGVFVESVGE